MNTISYLCKVIHIYNKAYEKNITCFISIYLHMCCIIGTGLPSLAKKECHIT